MGVLQGKIGKFEGDLERVVEEKRKVVMSVRVEKARLVIQEWNRVVKSRKKAVMGIGRVIEQKLARKFLSMLRDVSRIKGDVRKRKKVLKRLVLVWEKSRAKMAVSVWKSQIFTKHQEIKVYSDMEHHEFSNKNTEKIARLVQSNLNARFKALDYLLLSKSFSSLKSNLLTSRSKKFLLSTLLLKKYKSILSSSLSSWKASFTLEKHQSHLITTHTTSTSLTLKRKIFTHLRSLTHPQSHLPKLLVHLFTKKSHSHLQSTLQTLSNFQISRKASNYLQKTRATRSLLQWTNNHLRSTLRSTFTALKSSTFTQSKSQKSLLTVVSSQQRKILTYGFDLLRRNFYSQKLKEMEQEDGYRVREIREVEQQVRVAEKLLGQEKSSGVKEMKEVVVEEGSRMRQVGVRVAVLMGIMGEEVKMIANGFNIWRNKVRKVSRVGKIFENMDKRVRKQKDGVFMAFNEWKECYKQKEEMLLKEKKSEIQEKLVKILNRRQASKTRICSQNEGIYELEHQNRILVQNTISGQKMALSSVMDKYGTLQKRISPTEVKQTKPHEELDLAFNKWISF